MTESTFTLRQPRVRGRAAAALHPSVLGSTPELRVLVVGAGLTPVGMPRIADLPALHRDPDGTTTAFDPVALTDVARAKLPRADAVVLLAGGDHAATIATLRLVRRRLGDTPVVVLASGHCPDACPEAQPGEVEDYLARDDVDPATVARAVRAAIARRSHARRAPLSDASAGS